MLRNALRFSSLLRFNFRSPHLLRHKMMTGIEEEISYLSEKYRLQELFGAMNPSMHDLALPDITESTLKSLSNNYDDVPYLGAGSFGTNRFPIEGVITGMNNRPMVCLNCQMESKKGDAPIVKIWFHLSTSSNCSFLNEKSFKALTATEYQSYLRGFVESNDRIVEFYLSHSQFKEANILGMSAMIKLGLSIEHMDSNKFLLVQR